MNKKKSVTISDIAKRVGMTTITVSRALSKPDLVKPATLARILEVARELDYVPNAFARGLKRSESLILGVITASVDNPFYSEMIKAISREAKKHGYTIMLVDTDELEELESKAVDTLLGYRVAGSSCRRFPTSQATSPTTWSAWATARPRWYCSIARSTTARSAVLCSTTTTAACKPRTTCYAKPRTSSACWC